jgi:hypothetical protein
MLQETLNFFGLKNEAEYYKYLVTRLQVSSIAAVTAWVSTGILGVAAWASCANRTQLRRCTSPIQLRQALISASTHMQEV